MARRARHAVARKAGVAKAPQQSAPRRGGSDGGVDLDHTSASFEGPGDGGALAGAALSMMLAPIAAAQMRGGR